MDVEPANLDVKGIGPLAVHVSEGRRKRTARAHWRLPRQPVVFEIKDLY
jgi:hypothetical protein